MQEPLLILDIIPEKYLALAGQPLKDGDNLSERFWLVLRGFEKFGIRDYIPEYLNQFETALGDLIVCSKCLGKCCTSVYIDGGRSMYFGLDYRGMSFYNSGKPIFAVHMCPGPMERKEQIKKLLVQQDN
jgi:hypothetical protein